MSAPPNSTTPDAQMLAQWQTINKRALEIYAEIHPVLEKYAANDDENALGCAVALTMGARAILKGANPEVVITVAGMANQLIGAAEQMRAKSEGTAG